MPSPLVPPPPSMCWMGTGYHCSHCSLSPCYGVNVRPHLPAPRILMVSSRFPQRVVLGRQLLLTIQSVMTFIVCDTPLLRLVS
jgi:hypothetical protein